MSPNHYKKLAVQNLGALISKILKKDEDSRRLSQMYIEGKLEDFVENIIKEVMERIKNGTNK